MSVLVYTDVNRDWTVGQDSSMYVLVYIDVNRDWTVGQQCVCPGIY